MTKFIRVEEAETSFEYAVRLLNESKATGEDIEGEYGGARVVATPAMSQTEVFEAWSRRRSEIARRGFDEELAELARLIVGKKVVSVSAEFDFKNGPDRLTLVTEDGSRLTVHGSIFSMWRGNC